MNNKTLYQSRVSLMKGINEAKDDLVKLGWMVFDGKATRDDVVVIMDKLDKLTAQNSANNLDEMEDLHHHERN